MGAPGQAGTRVENAFANRLIGNGPNVLRCTSSGTDVIRDRCKPIETFQSNEERQDLSSLSSRGEYHIQRASGQPMSAYSIIFRMASSFSTHVIRDRCKPIELPPHDEHAMHSYPFAAARNALVPLIWGLISTLGGSPPFFRAVTGSYLGW